MAMELSRRRFIRISGVAFGAGLLPGVVNADRRPPEPVSWHGVALGAVASMHIYHPDAEVARRLVRRVVAEVDRLESIFSLYRADSALVQLNRRGVLVGPPAELVEVLTACDLYWRKTAGAFDPTVQPLWDFYSDHYAGNPMQSPPRDDALDEVRRRVGWPRVKFSRDVIILSDKGMGITLNGIAQGYITDKIVGLLARASISNALVDMGEIRAMGDRVDGSPWQVALDWPGQTRDTRRLVALTDRAIATSAAQGFAFDVGGRHNHLFDPGTGRCADPGRSVSVIAPTAMCADALSSAFSLMEPARVQAVFAGMPGVEARLHDAGADDSLQSG
jgi:thiamine biosynthesis lipoprotein